MRLSLCITAGTFLALTACGGSGGTEAGNSSAAAGAGTATSAGMKLEPGEWEVTVETLGMEAPGMPKEAQAAMAGQKVTGRNCLTAEQAEKPTADVFAADKEANCTAKDFSWAGGRVSGTMTCSGGEMGGTTTMQMDGQYSARSYEISQTMTAASEGGEVRIKSRMTGRRIGECPAGGSAEG